VHQWQQAPIKVGDRATVEDFLAALDLTEDE
jgi:hypothetical protein